MHEEHCKCKKIEDCERCEALIFCNCPDHKMGMVVDEDGVKLCERCGAIVAG